MTYHIIDHAHLRNGKYRSRDKPYTTKARAGRAVSSSRQRNVNIEKRNRTKIIVEERELRECRQLSIYFLGPSSVGKVHPSHHSPTHFKS